MWMFYYFKECSSRDNTEVKGFNESSVNKESAVEVPLASPKKFFTSREPRASAGTPVLRTYGKLSRPPAVSPGTSSAPKKRSKFFPLSYA